LGPAWKKAGWKGRLASLEAHPTSFTSDQKWVVFRSNMFGPSYVFAVEVAKAASKTAE
jgi:hypothetical protein